MNNTWKIFRFLLLAIATSIFVNVSPVVAQFTGPGGSQTETGEVTVASIKMNPIDDMDVVLQGSLLNKLSHEKYSFSDGTGEITVEIDDEDFGGKQVDPNTSIEIHGEVDVRGSSVQIDVDWFRIL
ncbi:MAG: NirD/YgiW/YdeI family stress tolerance protein [Xenococcus sp. MO_188.B8]|nr:NirD/YgiW/YdeI family stress tolerance protein [Xenococcus sp. MO_188.B8]